MTKRSIVDCGAITQFADRHDGGSDMFAVMVKPEARKRICVSGLIWVKDAIHEYYVCKKDRGLWQTKEDAEKIITEPWEMVVYVHDPV